MERAFEGTSPIVADNAYVAEPTVLVGDVTVGEETSLWPFVCLRGDRGPVKVGARTNVQEFSMLHGATLGSDVTVGHGAVVDFATVESHSLIGMGSAVMSGATVESDSIVAANAVVLQGQTVPEGHMAYGIPAEVEPLSEAQRDQISSTRDHYVELGRRFTAEADKAASDEQSGDSA